jgi:di/tricarboxylate transporter
MPIIAHRILIPTISVIFIIALVVSFPGPESITAGVVVLAIALWATGAIPGHLTAILFFTVAMLFSIAPANIVFSGFFSGAFWLVFSGLIIGLGINSTGLGKRIAEKVALHLSGSYSKLISGLVFIGVIFSFLMPSAMGRVVLLTPIALTIANHFEFKKNSNGFTAIVLAVILGSFIPAFSILPANVPNMILVGMTETLYQYSPLYGEYLLLHFPILGFIKAIIIIVIILWLFPDKIVLNKDKIPEKPERLSKNEMVLSIVLFILIILWLTDFLHNISPAWIALAGAVFLLFPKIRIVNEKQFAEKVNYNSLLYVAGILGLGGVINYSGLGSASAKYLISYLPLNADTPFINYISVSLLSMLTGIATTLPGVPAVLTPLSSDLSQATDLSLKSIFMTQVIGFSSPIFPYQAPPLLIGLQLAQVKLTDALKVCLIMAVISILLLLPLNYLWWQWLGWL